MLDTIALRHNISLLPVAEMAERGFTTRCGHLPSYHEYLTWTFNPLKTLRALPRMTWSRTPSGDWLTVEVSLPKYLNFTSPKMLNDADVQLGLGQISQFVSELIGVKYNAHTALVGRVDYFYDFQVGEENIRPYILLASQASITRMRRHTIEHTTVMFESKSKLIRFYGKHAEVAHRSRKGNAAEIELLASKGVLRLEISYRRSDSTKRLARKHGLPKHRAEQLLASHVAFLELDQGLASLGIHRLTESIDIRLDVLRRKYKDTPQCRRLVAFLGYLDRYGEKFWQVGIGGYSRSAAYRNVRELKNADVWLKTERQLPSLKLIMPDSKLKVA